MNWPPSVPEGEVAVIAGQSGYRPEKSQVVAAGSAVVSAVLKNQCVTWKRGAAAIEILPHGWVALQSKGHLVSMAGVAPRARSGQQLGSRGPIWLVLQHPRIRANGIERCQSRRCAIHLGNSQGAVQGGDGRAGDCNQPVIQPNKRRPVRATTAASFHMC